MSKRLRLRAPFVATVVAGAALGGCAITVVSPTPRCPEDPPAQGASCDPASVGAGTCGWGSCGGRPVTQAVCAPDTRRWSVSTTRCDITPPMRACPATAPTDGSTCDARLDPTSCNYGWSECTLGPAATVLCEGGRWRVLPSTCNPPPPACPASEPTGGTSCNLLPGMQCTYGDCFGSPTTFARCDNGTWSVAMASCNPPPLICPTETPRQGDACVSARTPPQCTYGDCYGSPTTWARCVNDRWDLNVASCNPPPVMCPPTPPPQDAPCSGPTGFVCPYDGCAQGHGVARAVCAGGRWQLQRATCTPVACPSTAPVAGDPCMHPESAECHYGMCGTTAALNYTCRGGRWAVDRAMCGDYCPPNRPQAGSPCSRDGAEPCRYPGAVCNGTQLFNEAVCNPMTLRWVITEFVCR